MKLETFVELMARCDQYSESRQAPSTGEWTRISKAVAAMRAELERHECSDFGQSYCTACDLLALIDRDEL